MPLSLVIGGHATLVQAVKLPEVPEMTWVRIVGKATFPIENGRRTAIIEASKVEKTAKMASLAPQDIKGAISIVKILSLSVSRVRAPMTAGTLQPKPTISGTKDFPGRPSQRISRSTTKAARAI